MTTFTPRDVPVAEVAAGLRAALDRLAGAMAAGDADAVLAAEPVLQAALAHHAASTATLNAVERDLVRQHLLSARAALARCRALGAGRALVAAATLEALGRAPSYGRQGQGPSRGLHGRLKARV